MSSVLRFFCAFFAILMSLFFINAGISNKDKNLESKEESPAPLPEQISSFDNHLSQIYNECFSDSSLDFSVFKYAMIGYYNLKDRDLIEKKKIVIIDYSQPSINKRFYVLDIEKRELLFQSLVAHGKNTGELDAKFFSNQPRSKKSSIGFFTTGETYDGKHEYSLKLDGLDTLYNHFARQRGIVIHGADYVSYEYAEQNIRIGRSFGCPALPMDINKEVIDSIKESCCLFIYYQDENYLNSTPYLDMNKAILEFTNENSTDS